MSFAVCQVLLCKKQTKTKTLHKSFWTMSLNCQVDEFEFCEIFQPYYKVKYDNDKRMFNLCLLLIRTEFDLGETGARKKENYDVQTRT